MAFALLGPTASGKSALALHLAERHPVEIVSVDSAQVYRGMDIGTAKPGAAARARVPHHLIDLVDPDQRYSAGQFRTDAIRAVLDILERRSIPLLVGGTMLYYRSLVAGLDVLPAADQGIRDLITAEAQQRGWREPLPFSIKGYALLPDRAELHRKIEQRFDAMLHAGLIDELKELRKRYELNADLPSMRAVGYRQAWSFLEGQIDEKALREQGIAATRQLAKRQVTWLRSFRDLLKLDAGGLERAAETFNRILHERR